MWQLETSASGFKMVARHLIDAKKWDACVAGSANESPLAYSWVLDYLSPGWEGLIIGDYEGVMPLTLSKNIGFTILQMPHEVLTLGIFSASRQIIQLFPSVLYQPCLSRFKFISYNGSPSTTEIHGATETITKQTYELELNKHYNHLYSSYSMSHRRSIKKFHNSNLEIKTDNRPDAFSSLIAEIGQTRPELYIPSNYLTKFENMTEAALKKGNGKTYTVWHQGHLIGATFFLKGTKRTILHHAANQKGRSFKTSFALIDHFIKENANTNMTLDFSGSVLPNIATFNSRFGAKPIPYSSVNINRLPFPINIAKEMNVLSRLKQIFFR